MGLSSARYRDRVALSAQRYVAFWVPVQLHQKLQRAAMQQDESMARLVRRAIQRELQQLEELVGS